MKTNLIFNVQTGADLIGINCRFGPDEALQGIRLMRDALDKERLKAYLMMQTIGYHAPDGGSRGFIDLPELEFGGLNSLSCLFGCSSSHPPGVLCWISFSAHVTVTLACVQDPPPPSLKKNMIFPEGMGGLYTGYIHPGGIIPCYSYMQVPQDRVRFSSYSIPE